MIIYGSKAVHIASEESDAVCEHCDSKGSMILSVFRKHAHIFWIPLFPFKKRCYSQCSHCKNVLKEDEMSSALKRESDRLKDRSRGPLWQWIGSILFFLLFGQAIITMIVYMITHKI